MSAGSVPAAVVSFSQAATAAISSAAVARRCTRGAGPSKMETVRSRSHLAKGLEFKAVAVMACDDDILPLQSRIEGVADELELDDVYETERHLFYVACTRARDRLLISGVSSASEFCADLC